MSRTRKILAVCAVVAATVLSGAAPALAAALTDGHASSQPRDGGPSSSEGHAT
ncbi:hypothetical protein GL263_24665 [Streptomyces durbertensis]|uniref:Uncharacterized protein n=1 Tax=Streptomyces durbertensis TaxID=2448886 RepID=A0ABR6EQ65_9ACTN|nr:hypothetical protein [Streptomyces durbertensis]MBB1246719.1 hypothetical protein [Streptomyces durbertensis]